MLYRVTSVASIVLMTWHAFCYNIIARTAGGLDAEENVKIQ